MILACLAVAVVAAAALPVLATDPEIAWRNSIRTVITTNGIVVATSTDTMTTNTLHTPAYKGQLLFGGAGVGTSGVWVAKGLTTNDWVRIAP